MLLAAVAVLVAFATFFLAEAMFVDPRIAAAIALVIVIVFTWPLFHFLPNEVTSWSQGAESERRVGAKLDSHPSNPAVSSRSTTVGCVDAAGTSSHIGRAPGVFVIETKHRGRSVEVIQGRFEVGAESNRTWSVR